MAKKKKSQKPKGRQAKVICAWCKKKMGRTQTPSGKASHSICKVCMKRYFPKEFVDIKRNPSRSSVMKARRDAINEAMDFQTTFEDKGENMSSLSKRDLLKDAMEAAQKMVNARNYFEQGQYPMAETIYESVRTILERLAGRMDNGY